MNNKVFPYNDREAVARYLAIGPSAFVPGHAGLLQMIGVLLAERMPLDGQILVVGAGGGLETRYLAGCAPGWRFVGVDPAAAMLDLALAHAGPVAGERLQLITGTVTDAPVGPFDAATCILVLGVLADDGAKLALLQETHSRLKTGAPFVVVDQCIDRLDPDFALRFDRYAAYAMASGVDAATVAMAREKTATNAHMVAPQRNEQLLAQAGFHGTEVFYVGMAWRGWVAYA